jgi:hypothetical protein
VVIKNEMSKDLDTILEEKLKGKDFMIREYRKNNSSMINKQ